MNTKIKKIFNNIFRISKNRSFSDISYLKIKKILNENTNSVLLDVRSKQEYKEYHLDGAINIPIYDLEENIQNIIPNKTTLIAVYCQSGARSKRASKILSDIGYNKIYNLEGGINSII